MEREASSARTTSTPCCFTTVCSTPQRGPATANPRNKEASPLRSAADQVRCCKMEGASRAIMDSVPRRGVAIADVSSAGHCRNVADQAFIDLVRLILVPKAAGRVPPDRHRSHSDAAHSYSVDLDAVRFCCLCSDDRLDVAAIVDAVGE